ncbi:serine hydrolase domain-containing protein [Streptomyces cinereoruber]|uniref:serine hydrolase domain-containing protein n=1 Tax=Streptomyces cinereoruber TaxID=67260 RepID=UPI003BF55EEE
MAISLFTRKAGAALAVAAALTFTAAGPVHGTPARTADQVMQDGLDAAVAAGYPGATALLREDGARRYLTAGVGDRATRTPTDPKAQVRIGSNTKPFIGAVTMMLADQGALSLDDTVDRWLPGVVTGNGNDGRKITVRQLLNHTSGVPEYLDRVTVDAYDNPNKPFPPAQLVRQAMQRAPLFAPGTSVKYSNTNFILLGMIIKSVTGNEPAVEVQTRLIDRLGLTGTSYPTSDPKLYGNHVRGYAVPLYYWGERPYVDVTTLNVQFSGAAGAMVSTLDDLATLHEALLDGTLLSPATLEQLKTLVAYPGQSNLSFGLAHEVMNGPGDCGKVWTKGGAIYGYYTAVLTREDGAQAAVATNQYNMAGPAGAGVQNLTNAAIDALCAL